MPISAADAEAANDSDNPFADNFNFGVFVKETGGKLFYSRNDVDAEIARSEQLGSQYYTLTYQPKDGDENGKFRRVRVTVRDRNLRVGTKAGYFAPDKNAPVDPRQRMMSDLADAAQSTVPFTALNLKVSGIVRHPDTQSAEFAVLLKGRNLDWQTADNGNSTTNITLEVAYLSDRRELLASRVETVTLSGSTQNPTDLAEMVTRVPVTVRVPISTRDVRVVIETEESGRIGAVDLDRSAIDSAPAMATPAPLKPPTR